MNRKTIIIYAALAIIFVMLGVGAWYLFTPGEEPGAFPPDDGGFTLPPLSTAPPFTLPTGPEVVIGTPQGNVAVKNFYSGAVEVTPQRNVVISRHSTYEVDYASRDSSFVVLILAKPFAAARAAAERAFLDVLGLTEADACKLKVYVAVPYAVDPALSGQDFPLSFCAKGL